MKKYLFTTAFVMAILYSCTSQTTPQKAIENTVTNTSAQGNSFGVSKEQLATAASLYEARCGKCHGLPETKDHSAEEWKPIMDAMAPKAKLTAEEKNWVLAYVSLNAK